MTPEEAFEEVKIALAAKYPFYYMFLKNFTVIVSDKDTNIGGGYASVTRNNEIILYKGFANLEMNIKKATIAHELLHILFQHFKRAENYAKTRGIIITKEFINAANIAADAVINIIVNTDFNVRFPIFDEIFKDIENKSMEELLDQLLKKSTKLQLQFADISCDLLLTEEGGGRTIQEGKLSKGTVSKEEIMKKAIEARIYAKVAGIGKSEIERIIDSLLAPQVNWKQAVKNAIAYGIMKLKVQTWTKPNRKLGDLYAGNKQICKPDIYCFIDTSASISKEELRQFISELTGMIREASKIEIVWWNDGIVGKDTIKSRSNIINIRPKGFGGTRFYSIIEEYKRELQKPWNIAVVLTDCMWYDKDKCEKELKKFRCHKILVSSTDLSLNGFDRVYHIEKGVKY
ncbi:hypothetical protein DRN69_00165 [Candidatus Pacearchaeota archaeon]|nr:MAG: hypothetical protein DRN69_00165 [Candidatus Pacearchaeota archaeon]